MQLREFVESIKRATDDIARSLPPDGDWEPMVFIIKDDHVTMAHFDMPESFLRDWWFGSVIPSAIKKVEPNPDAVLILVSSWMRFLKEGEDPENPDVMPSQDPEREECLVLSGVSPDEEIVLMGKIIRSENHPELEWDEPGNAEGRIQSALRRAVWD